MDIEENEMDFIGLKKEAKVQLKWERC